MNGDSSLREVTMTNIPYHTAHVVRIEAAEPTVYYDIYCKPGTTFLVVATDGLPEPKDVYVVGPYGRLGWVCVGEDVLEMGPTDEAW